MRKLKITALLLVPIMFMSVLPTRALDVSARSAVVIEAETGRVVFEKDADTRRPMASTTKIMTALVAIESGDLSREITVDASAEGVEGSSVYLKAGDKITLEALVWALMLESANDAAAAIAIGVAGSVDAFADLMNEKAAELGLCDTHFTNPHGLSDDEHYTTARELAKLTAAALENETFKKIVSTASHRIEYGESVRNLHNHNKMLRIYDGALGVKTGFTKASGRCLVSAAERDGLTLIAVTLNAPDDWTDHTAMLDLGFSSLEKLTLIEPGESVFISPCIGTESGEITIKNREGLTVILPKGEHSITHKVILPRYLWAPIKAGDVVGKTLIYDGETFLGEVILYADEDAERIIYKKNLFEKIFN
ncbi:MAG: D-alanyl-D-alanine carboxypeptidase [Clostridia bacterium]|nr:D-alanyl-D-alanine carboxypeptidase [Clostridia bacterium]